MPRGKNNAYNGKRNENSSFDYGLILMTNNKKHFSDFELKQLLREVETRQLTDKEIDILREMYLVRFGTAMNGICLLYTSPSPRDKRQTRMPSSA